MEIALLAGCVVVSSASEIQEARGPRKSMPTLPMIIGLKMADASILRSNMDTSWSVRRDATSRSRSQPTFCQRMRQVFLHAEQHAWFQRF